jgi:hypothetical protein
MADIVIDLSASAWRCQGLNADDAGCDEMVGKKGLFVLEFKRKDENLTVALCKKHAQDPIRLRIHDGE